MNFKKLQKNRGMTYVELIVVLAIAGLISGVSLFNYKEFQARVDMKNLTNDIASKIVEAQKNSISGKLPLIGVPSSAWRPSYGLYFDLKEGYGYNLNKNFYLFTDLDQNKGVTIEDINSCPQNECNARITLGQNYTINQLNVATDDFSGKPKLDSIDNLNINFTRPNSGAIFTNKDFQLFSDIYGVILYVEIKIKNITGAGTGIIKVYPSGRVEIM